MNENAVMNRAVNLKREGRYDEARELYHSVIREMPWCDSAYKGLSKVEIASGRYVEAIRALLMKIDLGIYFTKKQPAEQFIMICSGALANIDTPRFDPEIKLGTTVISAGTTYDRSVHDQRVGAVALLAWAEVDLFYFLGHCLMRLFPEAFLQYSIPNEYFRNFEDAVRGGSSGADARDTRFAPWFYLSGFWFAVANISSTIESLNGRYLSDRHNRRLDFMGLDIGQKMVRSSAGIPDESKQSTTTTVNQASGGGGCLTVIVLVLALVATCLSAVA